MFGDKMLRCSTCNQKANSSPQQSCGVFLEEFYKSSEMRGRKSAAKERGDI